MSACSRFFADILLTPLKATRIRLVSQQNYATGLVSGFARLVREGGVNELYAGFLPILCKFSGKKQIDCTTLTIYSL